MNQDDDDLITDKEIIYLQNIGERRELRHAYRDAIHDTSGYTLISLCPSREALIILS